MTTNKIKKIANELNGLIHNQNLYATFNGQLPLDKFGKTDASWRADGRFTA